MMLVNWPEPTVEYTFSSSEDYDTGWVDTEEGGMFAYLVVRHPQFPRRSEGGCNVDVKISLSQPDVQVDGPDLWEDMGDYPCSSEDVTASVFLGSTSHALNWQTNSGCNDYFKVTYEDLTDTGKALYAALEATVGPVDILTFLDT